MKAKLHPTVKQIAGGRPSTTAIKVGGAQPRRAICPVTELLIPECCCLRCFEQVMKPNAEALLAAGASRAGITDAAIALGYVDEAGPLTVEDVREPALQAERSARRSERRPFLSRRLRWRVQASGRPTQLPSAGRRSRRRQDRLAQSD